MTKKTKIQNAFNLYFRGVYFLHSFVAQAPSTSATTFHAACAAFCG
jgi:hypothetical protein